MRKIPIFRNTIYYIHVFSILSLLSSCCNCEKLHLTSDEREWVNHFTLGQTFVFRNDENEKDTLIVTKVNNYISECHSFEISKYQDENYVVIFKFKSKKDYNGDEPFVVISTKESTKRYLYIYLANLGPPLNDLDFMMPPMIDTTLEGKKLREVYYFSEGVNMESKGQKTSFKNFFWNKQSGLIAYTTMKGKLFLKIQ
jgi:hypothetical protein